MPVCRQVSLLLRVEARGMSVYDRIGIRILAIEDSTREGGAELPLIDLVLANDVLNLGTCKGQIDWGNSYMRSRYVLGTARAL